MYLIFQKTTIFLAHINTLRNIYSYLINRLYIIAHFLFQSDPIDKVKFKPIKIDIHQGVIKIVDEEIFYDFQLNTKESVIVGTDREEILQIKKQLSTERLALQLQPYKGTTLHHLFQKEVSEEDIINMNLFFTKLANSSSYDINKNDNHDNNLNNTNKTSIWKSLTEKLVKIQI